MRREVKYVIGLNMFYFVFGPQSFIHLFVYSIIYSANIYWTPIVYHALF